jgi:hypothetical protein
MSLGIAKRINSAALKFSPQQGLAEAIRSFEHPSNVKHILDRIEKRREIAGETRAPSLCIGGPSNFTPPPQPVYPIVTWPEDHDEEEEQVERGRYKELQAVVREIRVTNPQDAEMYVDILARNSSLLQTDKGVEFWIDWLEDLTQQQRA